jgi:hypothetical protein
MAAGVVAGTLTPPLPALFDDLTAEFDFPAFNYSLTAPVTELSTADDFQRITVKLAVDTEVILVCRLNGEGATNGTEPRPEVTLDFGAARPSARAAFVIATLKALFGLSETVSWRLPILQLDALIHPAPPLHQTGPELRRRKMAQLVMEIEQAFHQKFVMPASLSREEEDRITFIHAAMTEPSVAWSFTEGAFTLPANQETRARLESGNQSGVFNLETSRWDEELFGHKLRLGRASVALENATVINADEVSRETERLDGHEFKVVIRSLAGVARYEFPDAPRAPENWRDDLIEELVALRPLLIEAFFREVNELAAGCLPDFPEEELPPPFDEEVSLVSEGDA